MSRGHIEHADALLDPHEILMNHQSTAPVLTTGNGGQFYLTNYPATLHTYSPQSGVSVFASWK
jgi:hypothetical protein